MQGFPADYYAVVSQLVAALFLLLAVELRWVVNSGSSEALGELDRFGAGLDASSSGMTNHIDWEGLRTAAERRMSFGFVAGATVALGLIWTVTIAEGSALAALHRQSASPHDDCALTLSLVAMGVAVVTTALAESMGHLQSHLAEITLRRVESFVVEVEAFAALQVAAIDDEQNDEFHKRGEELVRKGEALQAVAPPRTWGSPRRRCSSFRPWRCSWCRRTMQAGGSDSGSDACPVVRDAADGLHHEPAQ